MESAEDGSLGEGSSEEGLELRGGEGMSRAR